MAAYSLNSPYAPHGSQVLWKDDERVVRRGWRLDEAGERRAALFVLPAAEYPTDAVLNRLRHEYEFKDELDDAWAVRPIELVHEAGRTVLVLEDPGGEPLERLLGAPMETTRFLRLAVSIAAALGRLHQRGVVHKDLKPVNILADDLSGTTHLTGFSIASRLTRERQSPRPPDTLAGTLAYMAPEQTGRMNRSVDSRSDLYALGVTFYQMLTGALPFVAAEPVEWVHCHLARRPVPPTERLTEIPGTVSAIVMKLLEKQAEGRYQSANGLERDLRRCQSEWGTQGRIEEFALGQHDVIDRLMIPEKLYGREHEVGTILSAFDRMAKGGAPELVLVSGYSGIGKSTVVNELQPALARRRALFASGKFDQYKRDIPYSTLALALQSLIRPLLSKHEADLTPWRDALREGLGANAGLVVTLVPEVKLIIGEPPPLAELPPHDAQRRFHLAFRKFVGVFARPEHPLAIFLDDLQWLDAATLELLEDLLTHSEPQHLLLIGAYRDNEVDASHALMRKLEAIRNAGGKVAEISLGPLNREHIVQFLADALHCEPERSAPLAQLVEHKTGGNPFFAIQFIYALVESGMLAFDYGAACWSWDLDRIQDKGYTDNIVDLMVGKLSRLPADTQTACQYLACLGNSAAVTDISTVLEASPERVHAALWEAVRRGLTERVDGSYKFIHDRVQEATYSQIPEAARAERHLRIGRLLLARTSSQDQAELIFDIVNHLNRGSALIASGDERGKLAALNLVAGKRAKASAAYISALSYFIAGAAVLDNGREHHRELIFTLELERAECEFLTGGLAAADVRLTGLANRVATADERARLAFLHMGVCLELVQSDRAVAVAVNYLRFLGIHIAPHPTNEEVLREYDQISSHLGGRPIEDVIELPLMSDPESLAAVEVLTRMMAPASDTDSNLLCLTLCRAVNLSLQRGNCDASCLAYVMLARVVIQRFSDYQTAFRFGQVGLALVEGRGLRRFEAGTYHCFAIWIAPWMNHLRLANDLQRRAFDAASKVGDLTYAGYAACCLHVGHLITGEPLSDVQRRAELDLAAAKKLKFGHHIDHICANLALVRMLRGLTPKFGWFDCEDIEELSFERHLASNPNSGTQECFYWIRKMQSRYYAGEYQDALLASTRVQRFRAIYTAYPEEAEYYFYCALTHAACCNSATAEIQRAHVESMLAHHCQLKRWAENCPENFENRAALVAAEIARIEGRELDAMHLYETAIRSSRASGFIHNEALAYERASEFHRARGFSQFADAYLLNARNCYASWGAEGKVRQLDRLYPDLSPKQPLAAPSSTITAPLDGLDLATVIRVSQAISSEIVLEKLLDTVLRTATEHAGAERGLLITPRGDELRVDAESRANGNDVAVRVAESSLPATAIPESIVRQVVSTLEGVILDDALSSTPFSDDPYILRCRPRSVLCLPLLKQARLTGILYLENNLTPRVFTTERITVLKVLASQAALSLENTRLYRSLEDREARIRRLVDANILGICIWRLDGSIMEANEAFLRMLQYDREDLLSARLHWNDITPNEWRHLDEPAVTELRTSGVFQPVEMEYFRRDGSRVPVLVGGALFQDGGTEGVAFVLDLSNRKQVEQTLRERESNLTNMNRVSMLGELAASLAHEILQPIAAARNNARAAMNFLDMQPPALDEVEEAIGCVVDDADRARGIVDRIRDQIKNAPPRKDRFDLNAAVKEVVGLARSTITKYGVLVQTQLTEGLASIQGDRIQVQQVLLNLVLNAVEAMDSVDARARELSITTEQDSDAVAVAVHDSGPGINAADLERVFEAFYTTKSSGVGMGLSICRSIIAAHGGKLWADANESRGATFRFILPRA